MSAEEELSSIRQRLELLSSNGNVLSVGFFNAAALKLLEASVSNALISARSKSRQDYLKILKGAKIPTQPGIDSSLDKHRKESTKAQEKLYNKYAGKLGSYFDNFKELKTIFGPGNEFARNLFLASKAFEAGTGILKKAFQASMTYMDAAKDLSDAGLMIGSSSNMLYRTVEGAYERFSDGTADFNSIITHSANLAGIRLEDFGEKLKNNSTFLTRMYAMGIEGTAEIGHLYATVAKRAGDMSQKNADAVVKQWSSAIMPFYTSEEIMANKLNGSFDNLVETMNYFMKATGKSAENLIKENEIKEKTAALEKLTAENPQIVSLMKSAGFSEEMIMHALTGRITGELNLQLMNSPIFSRGLQNVQQIIAQHRNDGYLNTTEGRQLFANTLLAAVNNAQPEKKRAMGNTGFWTYNSYMSYEEIRRRQGVEFLNPDFMNLNANVLGQNSSQTKIVESANELNRNRNKVLNDIHDLLSPSAKNIATITSIMSEITGIGHAVIPNSLTSPIMNTLIGGGALLGGGALATWGAIHGLRTMMGGGSLGTILKSAGTGAKALPLALKNGGVVLLKGAGQFAPVLTGGLAGSYFGGMAGSHADTALGGAGYGAVAGGLSGMGAGALTGAIIGGLIGAFGGPAGIVGGAKLGAIAGLKLGGVSGTLTGAFSGASASGSQLEQSARRGSTEGQPYYFNSPEIVNKLNQIQTVCQSLYGVACANRQMNTFARMDAVSASNK